MPTEEFMRAVLESEAAKFARGEGPQPPSEPAEPEEEEEYREVEQPEPAPELEEQEEGGEGEQEVAEDERDIAEEQPPDDEGEADQEPGAEEHGGEELIFGRYRTLEEAERGHEETRAALRTASSRAAEAERALEEFREKTIEELRQQNAALLRGASGGQQEFNEWADERIERDPEQGMLEAMRLSAQYEDESYAYAYADRWAESDPYRAAIARNEAANLLWAARQNRQQPVTEETFQDVGGEQIDTQQVINATWAELSEEYTDLTDLGVEMGQTVRGTPWLREMALEGAQRGDTEQVRRAFLAAREIVRKASGAPRRVRRSDAEQVAREKREASAVVGDGAPQRRTATSMLSPEEEMLLAGADKLGLKRRDE